MIIPKHIKKSHIAVKLYPDLEAKFAVSKFHNKLNNVGYAKLTEAEIKKVEEIMKKDLLI